MKLSELIKQLNKAIDKNGDCDVFIWNSRYVHIDEVKTTQNMKDDKSQVYLTSSTIL